eukprot:XP_014063122.1 PREDICTED: uncharacterized protein LOC106609167 [Salmo salar]
MAAPLTTLTSTSTPFHWTPEAEAAFLELNHRFTATLILTQPDPELQFFVEVDASDTGFTADNTGYEPDTIVPSTCIVATVSWEIESHIRRAQQNQPDPEKKIPMIPAHLHELGLGMLQGGMRTADVARAINSNVRTVRRRRQRCRETGQTADRPRSGRPRVTTPAQDRYIRTSHLRDRHRMATTTARVTPGTHNPSIIVQTVRNRLREAGLRACRLVVRQVLTRHHRQQCRLWAQTHRRWTRQDWQKVLWSGIDLEVEGPSWSGAVCHSIIELSSLSLQEISMLCVTGKTSSSLMWYPSCRLILI